LGPSRTGWRRKDAGHRLSPETPRRTPVIPLSVPGLGRTQHTLAKVSSELVLVATALDYLEPPPMRRCFCRGAPTEAASFDRNRSFDHQRNHVVFESRCTDMVGFSQSIESRLPRRGWLDSGSSGNWMLGVVEGKYVPTALHYPPLSVLEPWSLNNGRQIKNRASGISRSDCEGETAKYEIAGFLE
jgi:hypothetical protein